MSVVKATKQSEAGIPPDPALMEAVEKLTEEALRAGTIVDYGGLAPSSMGIRGSVGRQDQRARRSIR